MPALLEFYSDSSDAGKDIALKIFELGLKKCIQEPAYVQCYLDFLGHLNDDNSAFALPLSLARVPFARLWSCECLLVLRAATAPTAEFMPVHSIRTTHALPGDPVSVCVRRHAVAL